MIRPLHRRCEIDALPLGHPTRNAFFNLLARQDFSVGVGAVHAEILRLRIFSLLVQRHRAGMTESHGGSFDWT